MLKNQNDIYTDSNGSKFLLDDFIYESEFGTLAGGDVILNIVNIDADSDFVWVKTSFENMPNAGGTTPGRIESLLTIPNVLVAINDPLSGRYLQNKPVPINNFAGRAGLPTVLSIPREFKAKSGINITCSNKGVAANGLSLK